MSNKLNILITSGGTNVPIDEVRVISNSSSGTTGALIAEEALKRGHTVHLLKSKNAKLPFADSLRVDSFTKNINQELKRVKVSLNETQPLMKNFTYQTVNDFDDYQKTMLESVQDTKFDVVILSMAASDFGPEKVSGKISSDNEHLTLQLKKLPKIISEIKKLRSDIFLVGFKFLPADTSPNTLVEEAYNSLLRDRQNLVVANRGVMGSKKLQTYIVTAEKGIISVPNRDNLAQILLDSLEQRQSHRYYQTLLEKVKSLPIPKKEVQMFLAQIRNLANLALFPAYKEGDRREFGFLAKRCKNGTLITTRGSSKSQADTGDLCLVTEVDEYNRIIATKSLEKKASLNANLAHLIFAHRPDVNYVLHTHINLAGSGVVTLQSSPGTQEDWERIRPLVDQGSEVIYQPAHGTLILLKTLEDLETILLSKGIYSCNPKAYDRAYYRFQQNSRFIQFVTSKLQHEDQILDMCAGTGEVGRALFDIGFQNIYLSDQSSAMLEIAKEKLPELSEDRFFIQDLEDFNLHSQKFGGIVIRQAINYISPQKLSQVFRSLGRSLSPSGYLIFNSFLPAGLQSNLKSVKEGRSQDKVILTQEGNVVEGNALLHGQRTEIFGKTDGDYELVYDCNKFYLYSVNEYRSALNKAGFTEVEIVIEEKSIYVCARKIGF